MTEKQYLLGTDEQQQWMQEYTFAPRGIGFKEPGVLGMDAKEFSAFNVAKSFYQVHPEVFNLKLVAEKTGVAESEIAARLKRMCRSPVDHVCEEFFRFRSGFWVVLLDCENERGLPAAGKDAVGGMDSE